MRSETVMYPDGDFKLEGFVAYNEALSGKRPAVLVAHAWGGSAEFDRNKAQALAELGYVGFALDMYGVGRRGSNPDENTKLMQPFLEDRALLSRRINAALQTVRELDQVDASRIGAIGFCFGGLCVLDLARDGADVRGVVSFHGLFDGRKGLPNNNIKAKILALHGHNDPFIPGDTFSAFTREMSDAGADWQIHQYGHTVHAFTDPTVDDPENGAAYSPAADRHRTYPVRPE